ncbi:MAG: hypothetical protein GY719_30355 [bacterium]|nr:hypothetical protein [bacterium]
MFETTIHQEAVPDTTWFGGEEGRDHLKLFRRAARVGWVFCHIAGLEHTARQLVYDGGRPAEKVKPREGPVNVA